MKRLYINIIVPCYISIFSSSCIHCYLLWNIILPHISSLVTIITFQLTASNHVALSPFTRHSGHLIACDKFYANLVRLYFSFTRNDETDELHVFRNMSFPNKSTCHINNQTLTNFIELFLYFACIIFLTKIEHVKHDILFDDFLNFWSWKYITIIYDG